MEVVANKYKVIAHCYCIMGGGAFTFTFSINVIY